MTKKEQILNLRNEGKTFREIQVIVGCSKSTISYYCSQGQKEKTLKRTNKRRNQPIIKKLEHFKCRKNTKECLRKFQKRDNTEKRNINISLPITFNYKDVIEKYGEETKCYLSGEKINILKDNNYHLDHIIPVSKGGNNSLENLGILHETVNKMKHNLSVEEFIEWCKKILIYKGYTIS